LSLARFPHGPFSPRFPLKSYNLSTKEREYAEPPLELEGSVTRLWYESTGDTSSTELFRNYRNELEAAGFTILHDSSQDDAATYWSNFLAPFSNANVRTNRSNYIFYAADTKGVRTLSARLERPEGDAYVSVTTVEWPKDDVIYKSRRGAYAAVDLIQVKPMKQQMVVVKAEDMARSITTTGRIALYGIHFDTNSAAIKAESKPALEEIAKLLKQEADLQLHVVGHTDNVGGLDFNMDLSRRRAQAVVTALANDYGVDPARLTPNGVAYLAPVASNAEEAGRAKNRRVELVPR
jgi:OmpA-OmpF porin, OOP family